MPQTDKKTKSARVKALKNLSQKLLREKLTEFIGKEFNILAEDYQNGKTDSFVPIISSERLEAGKEYIFKCEFISENGLIGHPVKENSGD